MLNALATWLETERQWPQWASASCLALLLMLLVLHAIDRALQSSIKKQQASSLTEQRTKSAAFERFQRQYLLVYFLVMFADWLQGTHMYSLYQVRALLLALRC